MSPAPPPIPAAAPAQIDIGACIGVGIDTFKKNVGLHILAALLGAAISGVAAGILTGPMLVGYYRLLQKEARGEAVDIGDLFRGFDDFVPALVAALVSGLATIVGYLCCVVPGLLLMPLTVLSCYFVALGEKDGIQAVKRAFELVKQNLLMGMIAMIVLSILGSLGAILCFVGLLVTMPVAAIATHALCRQLTGAAA